MLEKKCTVVHFLDIFPLALLLGNSYNVLS